MQNNKRISWIDQLRGFAIFVVIYIHNFPFLEKYLYTFIIPLFITITGLLFPIKNESISVNKRLKQILIPYFFLSFFLFIFWLVIGKKMGNSAEKKLSVWNNFIGLFYGQGGMDYMDWGIPMWFLPMIFMNFLFYYLISKFVTNQTYKLIIILLISFLSSFIPYDLPWSINVAFVGIIFTFFGQFILPFINKINKKIGVLIIFSSVVLQLILYDSNTKIDMYRSEYGNYFLFIINSLIAIVGFLLVFKLFPYFRFFEYIGKFSILLLALHQLAMSAIKLFLLLIFDDSEFNFSEFQKFIFVFIQIGLIIPVFYLVNKFIPILNGSYKKI